MSVTVVDAVVRMRPDMGGTLSSLSLIERGVGLLLPLAAAAGAGALVKMGMDAQTQLSIVAGLTGSTAAQMSYYTTQLEGMGARFGMTLDESAKGLYYVVSAGYKGKDAIDVLTAAMLHAAATGVPLKDVANGLTSAMNAYGASASDATRYSDILTTAITYGKQTTADFANNVSKAALMAAAAHVPFTQLAAAEAALTEKGEPANRAFTELSFMMSKIAVPSADAMAKSVEKLGGHLDATKYQSADLMGKLLLLRNASGLTTDEFLKVVGGTRSARGALGLLADGGVAYNKILDQMRNNTGVTAAAFDIHTHTMQYAFDQVKASVSNAGYELVKMISPAVIPFLQGIAAAAGHLPDLFQAIGSVLGDTITKVDGPMQTFGRHTGEVSQILNTHKGLLSQVGDFLKPLFDSYTTVSRNVDNFRGQVVGTSTEVQRHKGLLSQLGDFVRGTLVPIVMHLAQVFQANILPVIAQVATFVQTQLIPTFKAVALFILGDVVPVLITLAGWIGKHVVPILAQLATIIRENVLPAVKQIWTSISENLIPAVEHLWEKIAPLVSLLLNGLGWVLQHIVGPALALIITIIGHVIDAVATIIGWIGNFIGRVRDLAGWLGEKLAPAFHNVSEKLGELHAWFDAKILPILKKVWAYFQANILPVLQQVGSFIRDSVIKQLQGMWDVITNKVLPILGAIASFLTDTVGWSFKNFGDAINAVFTQIGNLLGALGHLKDALANIHMPDFGIHIPGFAEGGVMPGGAAIVGENGPELALFPTGTRIIPSQQTAALMGGGSAGGGGSGGGSGGGYRTANITIMLDSRVLAQGLQQPLVDGIRIATGIRR